MEKQPIPESQNTSELRQMGEKLAALIDPVNMVHTRLDTLYENRLNETCWGYWDRPDFRVQTQSDPEHPFDISFDLGDYQGSTRRVASVKHNDNEVVFSFPNNYSWIDQAKAELETFDSDEEREEIGDIIQAATSIKRNTNQQNLLIQLTSSPAWNTPDRSNIKEGFRLTYQVYQDGSVKPLLPEEVTVIPSSTMQEVKKMTEALTVASRSAMRDKIELTKNSGLPQTPKTASKVVIDATF